MAEKKQPDKLVALPKSIIDFYAKFRKAKTAKLKIQVVMGTKFEIEDNIQIIDNSIHFLRILIFHYVF